MAQRWEVRSVLIPAGIAQASPLDTDLDWREGYPVIVEILFPPGPSGLVGIQLLHSGVPVIPRDGSDFIVTDNEVLRWPMEGFPYNNNWVLRGYNTDVYEHTIHIRAGLNEVGVAPITVVREVITAPAWESIGVGSEGLPGVELTS